MGWESRARGGRYYTRSRKVAGRVVREYVGTSPVAELMAEMDAVERTRRTAEREALRAEREQIVSVEALVGAACDAADLMVRTALVLAGYHQHKRGEWRKRRAWKAKAKNLNATWPVLSKEMRNPLRCSEKCLMPSRTRGNRWVI